MEPNNKISSIIVSATLALLGPCCYITLLTLLTPKKPFELFFFCYVTETWGYVYVAPFKFSIYKAKVDRDAFVFTMHKLS